MEEFANKLHFKCTNSNSCTCVTVYVECIYVLTEYSKYLSIRRHSLFSSITKCGWLWKWKEPVGYSEYSKWRPFALMWARSHSPHSSLITQVLALLNKHLPLQSRTQNLTTSRGLPKNFAESSGGVSTRIVTVTCLSTVATGIKPCGLPRRCANVSTRLRSSTSAKATVEIGGDKWNVSQGT